jgi:hypothetical protein
LTCKTSVSASVGGVLPEPAWSTAADFDCGAEVATPLMHDNVTRNNTVNAVVAMRVEKIRCLIMVFISKWRAETNGKKVRNATLLALA